MTNTDQRMEAVKDDGGNRSHSVDVGAVHRVNPAQSIPLVGRTQRGAPQPARNQSLDSVALGAKRPKLSVQIPSEQSDDGGSATAPSSPRNSGDMDTPAKTSTDASHSSGVVLPPPSPSAGALLSAGAQGPPNPFARPHLPMNSGNSNSNNQSYSSNNSGNNNIETPISALPSRFVTDGLLPSPSSFYPEWGFGRSGGDSASNLLPSPLNFQTPIGPSGPSFLRDEDGERKRKSPEHDGVPGDAGNMKRVKA